MELTGEGQGHCDWLKIAHSKCKTQTHGSHSIFVIYLLFLTFSHPTNHYSRLTSHTVLSLEQTAHPHCHGNSGTTAGSLVLLGVGHLNHSFPSSHSLSHAVIHIHPLSAHRSPLETMPVSTHRACLIATTPQ